MRILYVIDHLGFGGAQTALADLLGAWPCRADTIRVLGLGRKTELRGRFHGLPNVEVTTLGHRRWDLRSIGEVRRIIRLGSYDIVHAHLCKAVCITLWSQPKHGARLVAHVHNDMRLDWRILRLALRRWQARAAAVVAVSQHAAQTTQRSLGLPGHKLHVIHNPTRVLATDSQAGDLPRAAALRVALGLQPSAFVVGFVGRLSSEKGVTYLLQALAGLQSSRPEIVAIVIGDGPLAEPLRREAERRGVAERVRFVGYQLDIARWLSAVDVAVFPSLYEGLPVALVEAMRQGIPVIASDVDGVPEVVHPEQTGILTPAGDVAALQAAMMRLADARDLGRQLAQNARVLADRMFSPERIGRELRALYGELLQP
ncbi:MAG: glycosyltransferase family 4 protein [Planctomycetota bacterium]|nr:glycosyltransferase family 4 protein [Planctomycetota bacterium]